jgi:hypothetical protein
MSKQVPLLIVALVSSDDHDDEDKSEMESIKLLFKYGDDLRQDNLVL